VIKVAVLGAAGGMGSAVCVAVDSAPDMVLSAAVATSRGSDPAATVSAVLDGGAEVAVDFTHPDAVMRHLDGLVPAGVHAVVGTTGFTQDRIAAVEKLCAVHPGVGVLIAPNFSVGANLAIRFAREAAAFYESVEVVELHHPAKADAPSGTARLTAEAIAEARRAAGLGRAPDATDPGHTLEGARGATVGGVPVHSVRLQGLVAHEEIMFGGPGETLTIRHDSFDRASFMPGVLLGIREVVVNAGLTIGLDSLLSAR
jgi:4-hydroxy-tetrahydrodipicolinate reductase